jgi:hypothetical protein
MILKILKMNNYKIFSKILYTINKKQKLSFGKDMISILSKRKRPFFIYHKKRIWNFEIYDWHFIGPKQKEISFYIKNIFRYTQ